MGFADELRNTQNHNNEQEKVSLKTQWEQLALIFLEDIKRYCRLRAQHNFNDAAIYLTSLVEEMDERCTSKYTWGMSDVQELEYTCDENAELWESVRDYLFFYICGKRFRDKVYEYPFEIGMTKKNAQDLMEEMIKLLKKEGLTVEGKLKKDLYRILYDNTEEQMYSFVLLISW